MKNQSGKSKRRAHSKAFRSYLISYIGVVLLTVSIISILGAWNISSKMRTEERRVTEDKLYTMVEDLESQITSMKNMVMEVAASEIFHPEFFTQNKYNELELVKQFKVYNRLSSITNYYFLKYKDYETIFTSEGSTLPFSVYCKENFIGEDRTHIEEQVAMLSDNHAITLMLLPGKEETVLFVYPLNKYALGGAKPNAVLCFEVTQEDFNHRMQRLIGQMNGEVAVYYQNVLLNGVQAKEEDASMMVSSRDERVKILYEETAESYFSKNNIFSFWEGLILLALTFVFLLLAVFTAYHSYRPIRKLTEKYKVNGDNAKVDEFGSIDHFIDSLLQKEEKNNRLLQEQYADMRDQMLRIIFSGGYSSKMNARLMMLNISLDSQVYGVMVCRLFIKGEAKEKADVRTLIKNIGELTDDGVSLYAIAENEEELAVLVAAEESYQLEDARESLQALFDATGYRAEVATVGIYNDLQQISLLEEAKTVEQDNEGEKVPQKSNRTARQAVTYIEEHCTAYDLSLEMVAQKFNITATYLCRLIKQQTGVSYKDYLTNLRIEESKKMLQEEQASIAEVCQRVGYANVSHFIKVFQRVTGVTPAKYRNES